MGHQQIEEIAAALRSAQQADASIEDMRAGLEALSGQYAVPDAVAVEPVTLGGRPAEKLTANADGPVLLYLHGGGYVLGSLNSHRHLSARLAQTMDGVTYALDYRLAPEHVFPAAVEDGVRAYKELLEQFAPARIAIAGDSAGGGLTFATALSARDSKLPAAGCLIGLSPWVNLGSENESYDKLAALDPMLSREGIDKFTQIYVGKGDHKTPLASPLFGDLQNLPPTLIHVGDHEVFLGDAVRMHQNLLSAGVDSKLEVWQNMIHVWHAFYPVLQEGDAAVVAIGKFIQAHTTC